MSIETSQVIGWLTASFLILFFFFKLDALGAWISLLTMLDGKYPKK